MHTVAARYPPKEDDQEYVFDVSMPFPVYVYEILIYVVCLNYNTGHT